VKVVIDVDDVLLDTIGAVLRVHNSRCAGHPLNRSALNGPRVAPPGWLRSVHSFYDNDEMYPRLVQPMPGAADALAAIRSKHDVVLLSAFGSNDTTARKSKCLERHMPEHAGLLVGCVKGSKAKWKADVFVDDQISNITDYRSAHRDAVTVCIDQPWNQDPSAASTIDVRWLGVVEGNPGLPALARWLTAL